ncbi:MAG TPA: rhomboid family intramembrane serine protease [Candidatus Polarisedimenticolaceae bacterium]|nr:rhomboid family intramembrane serine protease [Candidatus Polarisedimenticolaceae bacterium]
MGDEAKGLLDRAVELLARLYDAVGLNGTRLRWRWNQRRRDLGEAGMRAEMFARSTRGSYKMCPSCRALVPRSARTCSECGARLSAVRAPGLTRAVQNLIPGATATTGVILGVNTILFAVMLMIPVNVPGEEPGSPFARLWGFDGYTLIRYGSGYAPLTIFLHEAWRIVTPVFLHAGIIHFAFNSMALVQLGPLVEEEYGTERLAAIYLACGIAGSAASQYLRHSHTVGASGAICGLLGLLLVHGYRMGGAYGTRLRSAMMQNILIMGVLSFVVPRIDWMNHLGGLAMGALLGLVVPAGPFRSRGTEGLWQILAWGAVAIALASFWMMAGHGMADVQMVLSQG